MKRVVIIDYGSQYTHLIKYRFRELGHDALILPPDTPARSLKNAAGLVLSGGPKSVYEEGAPQLSRALTRLIFEKEVPTLAICYGMQLIAEHASKKYYSAVEAGVGGEYGRGKLKISHSIGVLRDVEGTQTVWMSHGDTVICLPPDFHRIARTQNCPYSVIQNILKPIFCLQFHPEVSHTKPGKKILANFLEICGAGQNWDAEEELKKITRKTKRQVGGRHVFGFISGGNDSSVLALFLKRVLPQSHLHLFYVRGLGDDEDLGKTRLIGDVHVIDARNRFYKALEGLIDPEEKRRAIGETFEKVFKRRAKSLAASLGCSIDDLLLAQGTIYPDVIESGGPASSYDGQGGSQHADRIKSHHNLMISGEVLEPFRNLFKPDIRKIGRMLGVDERLIAQHPFPGPGYAIRFLCSSTYIMPHNEEFRDAVEAEHELMDIAKAYGYSGAVLPIKSKGVQGDRASYCYTAAISGPYDKTLLLYVASLIPERLKGRVNRVLYIVRPNNKPDLWGLGLCNDYFREETNEMTADANQVLIENLRAHGMYGLISQAFVVLAPLSFDLSGYSAIIRTVDTEDYMTASPHFLPQNLLEKVAEEIIQKVPAVQAVFYDLSTKPPGTIEWE